MTRPVAPDNRLRRRAAELAADNRAGATELTRRCADLVCEHAGAATREGEDYLEDLTALLAQVLRGQPSMASLFNLANEVLLVAADAEDPRAAAPAAAVGFQKRLSQNHEACVAQAAALLAEVEVAATYSASSLVAAALTALAQRGARMVVYCSESRPAGEGVDLARRLAKAGLSVKLFTDAGLFSAVRECRRLIVGADALLPEGVVNKLGTRPLAVCAGEAGIPATVLATSEKRLPPAARGRHRILRRAPEEILPDAPPGVEVVNRYFDLTPYSLIAELVDESGAYGGEDAARKFEDMQVSPWLQRSFSR